MYPTETLIKSMIAALIAVLLAASAFSLLTGWYQGHFDSIDSFSSYIASYGMRAPLVLALIQMLLVLLPILPTFAGYISGAVAFGPAVGFLLNYTGICTGSIAAYSFARYFGTAFVDKMISVKKYDSTIQRIEQSKHYNILLFLAILLPLAPDNFLCYFSGLIKMSPKKFIAIIILGKPWCILFYSIFFSYFL